VLPPPELLDEPPPQDVSVIARIASAATVNIGVQRNYCGHNKIPDPTSRSNERVPKSAARSAGCWSGPWCGQLGVKNGAALWEAAVVVTVTVAVAADVLLSEIVFGETVHVARAGAPVQASETFCAKPPAGTIDKV